MTMQMSNTLQHHGQSFDILTMTPPWQPQELGIRSSSASTACHRGYLAHFVVEQQLTLKTLTVNAQEAPPLNGIEACRAAETGVNPFNFVYQHLQLPLNYSGDVEIASGYQDNYLQEFFNHRLIDPRAYYQQLLILSFSNGKLVRQQDVSANAAAIRQQARLDWQQGNTLVQRLNAKFGR